MVCVIDKPLYKYLKVLIIGTKWLILCNYVKKDKNNTNKKLLEGSAFISEWHAHSNWFVACTFVLTNYIAILFLSGWSAYCWNPEGVRLAEFILNNYIYWWYLNLHLYGSGKDFIWNFKKPLPVAHCCKSCIPLFFFLLAKKSWLS